MSTGKRLFPGRVVRLRVNPTNCMSVVDVLSKLGIPAETVSFDQAVSLALSSLLESARVNNVLPTRDGFEYTEMMQRFRAPRADTLRITELLRSPQASVQPIIAASPEATRKKLRFEELAFRKQSDPTNWSEQDEQEYVGLVAELYD